MNGNNKVVLFYIAECCKRDFSKKNANNWSKFLWKLKKHPATAIRVIEEHLSGWREEAIDATMHSASAGHLDAYLVAATIRSHYAKEFASA